MFGGLGRDGGMAEYMIVPESRFLVRLGKLEPKAAAPLTDAAMTPYHAIKGVLPVLTPDSTVVMIGIGGLGHMGVQIRRRYPLRALWRQTSMTQSWNLLVNMEQSRQSTRVQRMPLRKFSR